MPDKDWCEIHNLPWPCGDCDEAEITGEDPDPPEPREPLDMGDLCEQGLG